MLTLVEGYVCHRQYVNASTGCCLASNTTKPWMFYCSLCQDQCCPMYEHCVGCCMDSEVRDKYVTCISANHRTTCGTVYNCVLSTMTAGRSTAGVGRGPTHTHPELACQVTTSIAHHTQLHIHCICFGACVRVSFLTRNIQGRACDRSQHSGV